eukprot:8597419-Pyramimonas_sp.AAC.1
MAAALQGHEKVCECLLDNGADGNIADQNKETALYAACLNGHVEVVDCLIKHASLDPNDGNAEGETPLIAACWNGHQPVVETLLASGADMDKQNENGKTPLIASCWRNFPNITKALVSAHASIHKVDEHGRTALWAACRGGSAECIQLVLDHGGDPDQMDDRKGAFDAGAGVSSCSPLFAAAWQGHIEAVECMLKNGADPELGDSEGRKPGDVTEKDEVKAIVRNYSDMKYNGTAPPACSGKPHWPPTYNPFTRISNQSTVDMKHAARRGGLACGNPREIVSHGWCGHTCANRALCLRSLLVGLDADIWRACSITVKSAVTVSRALFSGPLFWTVYSHDEPIGRWTRGYILTTNQSLHPSDVLLVRDPGIREGRLREAKHRRGRGESVQDS